MSKPKRYPVRMSIGFTEEEAEYLDDLVLKKEFESIAHAIRNFVEAGIALRKAKAAYDKLDKTSIGDN